MIGVDPVNRKYLEDYARHSQLQGLKQSTITSRCWSVYAFMKGLEFKDVKTVSIEDVENYYLARKKEVSPFTLQGDLLDMKLFLRWLLGEDREKELVKTIKFRKPKRHLPTDSVINEKDITALLKVVDSQRDRALIMLLWDSGARLGEVTGLNIGDVQVDQYGAVINLEGKTGQRRVRLTDSVPDLQRWLDMHPARENPQAPLFVTMRGLILSRLQHRSVQGRIATLAKRAGLKKRIHPHGFRHGKLTALTREGFTESDLKLIAGWTAGSNMAETYVHLSMRDVEQKILAKKGLIEEGHEKPEDELKPRSCPRCSYLNAAGIKYCGRCSMILDSKAALEHYKKEEIIRNSAEYEEIKARLDRLERQLEV